jgi:hypothetical protein
LFSGCFSGAAYAVGNGSLDLGRGGNVVCVCLLTTMPQLRGGYWLRPIGLVLVICQISEPFLRLSQVPTADLPGPELHDLHCLCDVNEDLTYKLDGVEGLSLCLAHWPQLTAAAETLAYALLPDLPYPHSPTHIACCAPVVPPSWHTVASPSPNGFLLVLSTLAFLHILLKGHQSRITNFSFILLGC